MKKKPIDDMPMLIMKNIANVRKLNETVIKLQEELQKKSPKASAVEKLRLSIKKQHDKLLGSPAADWSCAMARDILKATSQYA